MACTATLIRDLVTDALSHGEMRHLSLVVAVRRGLGTACVKGDLSRSVKSAVQELMRAEQLVETDGVYGLTRRR